MIFRKAILIIHGFMGGTYDEEDLANYLELERKFDVFQFTLPGHKRNLSKVKYGEWISKSEEMVNWLIKILIISLLAKVQIIIHILLPNVTFFQKTFFSGVG